MSPPKYKKIHSKGREVISKAVEKCAEEARNSLLL
jgi:hypothetical protein